MAQRISSVLTVLLLSICQPSFADEPGSDQPRIDPTSKTTPRSEAEHLRLNHGDALGDDRWCILTFIQSSRQQRYRSGLTSRQVPIAVVRSSGFSLTAEPLNYTDATSPMSRLSALRDIRLATVWRGRQSELVFGVDSDGYLGLHLEDTLSDTE